MNRDRRQDRGSLSNKIYVSGILPGTHKSQLMSYFQGFGNILDVEMIDRNLVAVPGHQRPWEQKARSMRHYCILVCQDLHCYRQVLKCTQHYIRGARVFCEPHLTGEKLIEKNNQNNLKRAFIRYISLQVEIDQLLEIVEGISGPIESFQDFAGDIRPTSKHYSISITFRTREGRDIFCRRWENQGLRVLGKNVVVQSWIDKKKRNNQRRNTSTIGDQDYLPNRYYPSEATCNTLKNKDTSLSIDKENTFEQNRIQSTGTKTQLVSSAHDNLVPRVDELWKLSKPTTKGYHKQAFKPRSGVVHPYHNIRLNVLLPSTNVHLPYRA